MTFSWEQELEELARRRERAMEMGGPEAIDRQRARGKQTVRERLDQLVDRGSFKEIGTLATYGRADADNNQVAVTPSSYICGLAKVDGRPVAIGAQDYTVSGGVTTLYLDRVKGEIGGFVEDLAHEYQIPFLQLMEGVGGGFSKKLAAGHGLLPNSSEGVNPGAPYLRSLQLLQEVPCLTAVLGPTAGFAAARAVLAHFTVMTRHTACIFIAGPAVVKGAIGTEGDMFALGGAHIHTTNGAIDNVAEDEADAIAQIKTVLSYLPQNVWELPPVIDCDDPIERRNDEIISIIPENHRRGYDVRSIVETVFDRGSFFEIGRDWGQAVVQGLARIGGRPVAVFASNSKHIGGALDAPACEKQARLMEFCDLFHLPMVYFVDSPGFMIGEAAERSGIARSAMRAIEAAFLAEVPLITIHMRKTYGMGPLSATNPARLGLRLAWPSARWGGLPAESGVDVQFRRQIETAADPEEFRRKATEAVKRLESPWPTAEAFGIEEIIHPAETREYIARFVEAAWGGLRSKLGPPRYRPRI